MSVSKTKFTRYALKYTEDREEIEEAYDIYLKQNLTYRTFIFNWFSL